MSQPPTFWIVYNYRAYEMLVRQQPKSPPPIEVIALAERPQGLQWSDIIASLPTGTRVVIETLSLVGDSPKVIAQLVKRFISKGHSVCFAREEVMLSSSDDDAYKLLQAMPDPMEANLARQREGMARAKEAGKSNWINPDQSLLKAIKEDVAAGMTIKNTCEIYGISRPTYYQWKTKGLL